MANFLETTFDDVNFPTVRAPGIHWEQTVDGLLDAAVGQSGDGFSGQFNDVTSPNGQGEQILAAANNPDGGGGKGFRHWVGNGDNNCAGSLEINWADIGTSKTEYWMRWYMRFQSGFAWGSVKNMKCLYNNSDQCAFYFGIHDSVFGGHVQHDGIDRNTWGQGNLRDPNTSWEDLNGSSSTGDGLFHCWEIHVKLNTSSNQDGVFEAWFDDQLLIQQTNVRYRTDSSEFEYVLLGQNHIDPQSGSGADQYVDFDDLAFSVDGRIGPLSGSGPSFIAGNRAGVRRGRVGFLR